MRPRPFARFGFASALLLTACGEPPSDEARFVEAGFVEDDTFEPLVDGEVLFVREGLQTGKWIMPSIRAGGFSQEALVHAEVVLEDGQLAGEVSMTLRFARDPNGDLRVDYIPVPIGVVPGGASLDEIYGSAGTLRIELDDGDAFSESETAIQLENGDV